METYAREEAKTETIDDSKARELLRRAFTKTSRWPDNFGGFEADLRINVNGEEATGKVTVKSSKEVEVSLPNEELQKWAQGQISMIAAHRGPRNFEESDGKYNLSFEGEENHPQGPRIGLGDSMGSTLSYQGRPYHPDQPEDASRSLYDQRRRQCGDAG